MPFFSRTALNPALNTIRVPVFVNNSRSFDAKQSLLSTSVEGDGLAHCFVNYLRTNDYYGLKVTDSQLATSKIELDVTRLNYIKTR
jgi:hypothetical protein